MSPKRRSKSKISFKIFSNNNYSKFSSRFPFLKERQIKAKLLQAWRNKFRSEATKDKGEIKTETKQRSETLLTEAESKASAASQEDAVKTKPAPSPLSTYSVRRHKQNMTNGFAIKEKPNLAESVTKDSSTKEVCASSSNVNGNKGLKKRPSKLGSTRNELIDLFEEINRQQLLIEPEDTYESDSGFVLSTPGCFNHQEWLKKLTEEVQSPMKCAPRACTQNALRDLRKTRETPGDESGDGENTNTVSGMFKWRADRKRKMSQKDDGKRYESRCLVSNERKGSSNFFSMFDGEEDIFL